MVRRLKTCETADRIVYATLARSSRGSYRTKQWEDFYRVIKL
jgi:hypothetical protein